MNYAANRTRNGLAIAVAIAAMAAMAFAAQVPSLDEVYRTARAGDLPRADAMMQQVLNAYPNSARAHYAYAQILTAEGRTAAARAQLTQAERIAPGLPFVSPQARTGLEQRLQSAPTPAPAAHRSQSGGIPWFWLLVGGGIVWFVLSRMRRRAAYPVQYRNAPYPSGSAPAGGYSYGAGPQPYAGAGGGWWSSIMSGLGFGAGAAAGQYAADRFLHRGEDQRQGSQIGDQPVNPPDNAPDNLGGDDFGMGGGNSASGGWTDPGVNQPASGDDQPAANDSDSAFGMSPGDGNDGGWDDSSGGGGGTDV